MEAERVRRAVRTLLPVLLILVLAATLVPALAVGQYARAAADDYSFGRFPFWAVQEGKPLLPAVWDTITLYYFGWQGTFSAIALMSVTPCVFSEQLYGIATAAVMLFGLSFGTVKLADTLVRKLLGGDWRETVCVAVPLLLVAIQTVPSPINSFYWWNGALYYTFTYGVSLLYVERFIRVLAAPEGRVPVWPMVSGALCAVLVGGSNYVSALLTALLGGCLLLWALVKRRRRVWALGLVCAEVIPFLVSMLAPGNQVRQAGSVPMPPVEAIFRAIGQAGEDMLAWPTGLTAALCLFWAPVLLRLAGRSGLKFRLPPVFAVFTFLLFAAQNTPHFYALSTAGPERLRNIVYFSSFWLVLVNEWYLLGWVRRVVLSRVPRERKLPAWPAAAVTAAALLLAVVMGIFYAHESFAAECVRELSDGSAAAYAAERDARLAPLMDPTVTDVVYAPIQNRPPLLYQSDLSPDPNFWANSDMAIYWGKTSIALERGGT